MDISRSGFLILISKGLHYSSLGTNIEVDSEIRVCVTSSSELLEQSYEPQCISIQNPIALEESPFLAVQQTPVYGRPCFPTLDVCEVDQAESQH
jgi:hypothetical protein